MPPLAALAFVTVEGQFREKRFAEDATGITFCTDALLAARNGAVAHIEGYVEHGGHMSARLAPDTDTATRRDWRRDSAVIPADILGPDGSAHPLCSRGMLRAAAAEVDKLGQSTLFGAELEFFLIPQCLVTQAAMQTLHLGTAWRALYARPSHPEIEAALDEIILLADRCSIPVLSVNREFAGFQYEVSLPPRTPLTAADDIVLIREIIDFAARRHGLAACFLPKPFSDQVGSGMHLNMSLHSRERPLFTLDQEGLPSSHLTRTASSMARHLKACCAIWAPSVNSYRRLATPDFSDSTPFDASGRRDTLQRVAGGTSAGLRLELRVPDCLANPYVSIALCLKMLQGSPGAEEGNWGEGSRAALPGSLSEAMTALEGDFTVRSVLGGEFYTAYSRLRNMELVYYAVEVSSVDFRFNAHRYIDSYPTGPDV